MQRAEARLLKNQISDFIGAGFGVTPAEKITFNDYVQRSVGLIPARELLELIGDLLHERFMRANNTAQSNSIMEEFHKIYPGRHWLL